ncbi:helix-turn-helix transcriptional regulator [Streptomyces sp. NPDC003077]|uniref:helix-turn-helix domain-containing protein n=1 Tax=Streptomyces sp. NPDC003077 TaxID=3154443 RepID=UPI0033AF06B2
MAATRGPTGRRLELGIQLRELRESAFMDNGKPMTRKVAIHGTKLSEASLQRIETGRLNFRNVGDLRKLLDKYGVNDPDVIDALVDLNREATRQEWVTRYRNNVLPGMRGFVGLEAEAQEIRLYHPAIVHGLLQTESYARAVFENEKPVEETTSEFVRNNVALRMERKERVLERDPDPVKVRAVLGEAALRYVIGGADIMRNQYDEIARLSVLPHVTVQVLPLSSRGYRASSDLAILTFPDRLPPMVQVDNAWGAMSSSDRPKEIARFLRRFDAMVASALPPEDTPEFLQRLAKELTSH